MVKKEKKTKTVREAFDTYITPTWTIERLLEKVSFPTSGIFLDPCAGTGVFIDTIKQHCKGLDWKKHYDGIVWKAVEIQEIFKEELSKKVVNPATDLFIKDYTALTLGELNVVPSVIISNPPYKKAIEFIRKSMEFKPDYICFLLRINFLASKERAEFFHKHTPDIYVLPDRPSFVGKNGDMTEYGFFIWRRDNGYGAPGTERRIEVLNTTPLSIRRPKKVKINKSTKSVVDVGSIEPSEASSYIENVKKLLTPMSNEEFEAYKNSKEAKTMKRRLKKALEQGEKDYQIAVGGKLVRNMSTKENRKYWASIEENARQVSLWPEWKRGAISGEQQMKENHKAVFCDHANEVPSFCPCKANCYCKTHTCKGKE